MPTLRQQLTQELVLRGYSPSTQRAYIRALYELAKYYKRSPDLISDQEVRQYLLFLAETRKLTVSTRNQAVSAFRFFYCHVLGRPGDDVVRILPRVRKPVKRPQVFAISELEKLFTVGCPNPRNRALLMTIYGAGLRVSEACHLKNEHILSERRQIRIVAGKGQKDRYSILSPRLLQELRCYWRYFQPKEWLFPACADPTQPIQAATVQKIFYKAVERAGLSRKGGVHSLRHSFATHLLEAGVEITVLQHLLGHNSLSTTSTYLHVRQQRLAQITGPLDLVDLSSLP